MSINYIANCCLVDVKIIKIAEQVCLSQLGLL